MLEAHIRGMEVAGSDLAQPKNNFGKGKRGLLEFFSDYFSVSPKIHGYYHCCFKISQNEIDCGSKGWAEQRGAKGKKLGQL